MSTNAPTKGARKNVPWSQHEDATLLCIIDKCGSRWSIIASSPADMAKALGSRYRELRKKEHAARGKRFTAVVGGPVTRARSSQVSRQRQPHHQHQDAGASQPQHQHQDAGASQPQHQHQDAGAQQSQPHAHHHQGDGAPQPQGTPQTSEPTSAAGTDTQPPRHQGDGATPQVPAPFAETLAAPTVRAPLRVTTLNRGYVVRNYRPGSRIDLVEEYCMEAYPDYAPLCPPGIFSFQL